MTILSLLSLLILVTLGASQLRSDSESLTDPNININAPYNLLSPSCDEPFGDPIPWGDFAASLNLRHPHKNHVVIPCGETIIIPAGYNLVFEKGLTVQGKLLFEDDVTKPIQINSAFILNLGWIHVGSEEQPFESRLNFVLTAMEGGVEVGDPALGAYGPLDLGQKGFVTLGGQVLIFAKTSNVLWTHLQQNAKQGETEITVKGLVDWNVGDSIGIASSTLRGRFSSYAKIKEVNPGDDDTTQLILEKGLENSHFVRYFNRTSHENPNPEPPQVWINPEVIRLSRRVIIMGSFNPQGFGGYFMITHSAMRQVVEGVEFVSMGQTGVSGRYPLHISFGGYTPPGTRFSRNSIHHSYHRCIVVQATHNVLIERNMAYHNHGHCYVVPDGMETNNTFIGNVAMNIKPPGALPNEEEANRQSDNFASGFYLASVSNTLINNIVAGAEYSGYFYEPYDKVRGEAQKFAIPGYENHHGKTQPFGIFKNNLAHSVQIGLNPGYGVTPPDVFTVEGFTAWSVASGIHTHTVANIHLRHISIIDFYSSGIHAVDAKGFSLESALIVGELNRHSVCDSRDITGLQLSTFDQFSISKVHFMKISTKSNCQNLNVGLEILKPTGYAGESIHGFLNTISFYSVDTHYKIQIPHPVVMQVSGGGAGGNVKDGDSIVSIGWEGFEDVVSGLCIAMPLYADGQGVVQCPGICWKSLLLKWKEPMESQIRLTERRNGRSWVRTAVKDYDEAGNEIWVAKFTLPSGGYNIKVLGNQEGLLESVRVPPYERQDLSHGVCEGEVTMAGRLRF